MLLREHRPSEISSCTAKEQLFRKITVCVLGATDVWTTGVHIHILYILRITYAPFPID